MATNYKFPDYAIYNIPAYDMTFDSTGNMYIAGVDNKIWKVDVTTKTASVLAGGGGLGLYADGIGANAFFNNPVGITIDSTGTNLYIVDQGNMRIRKVVISSGIVTTIAGDGTATSLDGIGTNALFSYPTGIVIDSTNTNLYIGDMGFGKIRKLVISSSTVTTIAGNGAGTTSDNAVGTSAGFKDAWYIAIDSTDSNLYVCERFGKNIRKVALSGTYPVTTVSSGVLTGPIGIAIDSTNSNLYVSDGNNNIKQIVISSGAVTTLAGLATGSAPLTNNKSLNFGIPALTAPLFNVQSVKNYKNTLYIAGTDTGVLTVSNGVVKNATMLPTGYSMDFSDAFIPRDLFSQGGLWTWGSNITLINNSGQLGDNTVVAKSSPVQTISGGTNWKQVSSGTYHTAAIKTDGTLWTWGYNSKMGAPMGIGSLGDNTGTTRTSPVQTISAGTNWKLVAAAMYYTAAIKTDGTLWTWGDNGGGQLGDNTTLPKSSPVQTISGGTNWKQVSCTYSHTGAIKTDGTLWSWGYNNAGALGDNTTVNKSSPVQTISGGTNWKQVACGAGYTAAIKTDGTLWLWGQNNSGQLGDNTNVNKSSPVQTISAGTNWKQVACGGSYTAAIKTDGTLWTWGDNNWGKLGDNTNLYKSSPVQTIAAGTNWKQVSCGDGHTAAIKTDGTLWLWGNGSNGRLGDNTTLAKSSPVQTISGGTNWKQVSGGNNHTAAITDIY